TVAVVVGSGFFFFQAEDGIRDFHVTGVQTCALPICSAGGKYFQGRAGERDGQMPGTPRGILDVDIDHRTGIDGRDQLETDSEMRSEERRVGKECRTQWPRTRKTTWKERTGRGACRAE